MDMEMKAAVSVRLRKAATNRNSGPKSMQGSPRKGLKKVLQKNPSLVYSTSFMIMCRLIKTAVTEQE